MFYQLKIAFRNLRRNGVSSVINVLGLSLGITSCLVIFLITRHELSFDTFHPDKERIYRLVSERERQGQITRRTGMLDPMVGPVRQEITGLETVSVLYNYSAKVRITEGNNEKLFEAPRYRVDQAGIVVTDPWYFDIFHYDWLAGNQALLNEPFMVVLTGTQARKYFGDMPYSDYIGKEITYGNALHVTVAGIVKEWERNTDFIFTDFISTASVPGSELKDAIDMNAWGMWNSSTQLFVKLAPGVEPETVEAQFPAWMEKYVMKGGTEIKFTMQLQPLSDIHFNTELTDDYSQKAHLPTLYGLMALAAFILIIAACNFINLSTAQSLQRAREIGIRKVLGGSRDNLVMQFLGETFVVTLFAVLLSLLTIYPILHAFRSYMPQGVSFGWTQPFTWLFLLGVVVLTTLLAGFYPARMLSGGLPVDIMKGSATHKGSSRNLLRKSLIVFQFTISLVFIICTLVVGDQIHYLMNKDMGFDKDAIVTIRMWGNREVLTSKVSQFPYVGRISVHTAPPAAKGHSGTVFKSNIDGEEREVRGAIEFCDENFIPLYGLRLIAGRNLLPSAYMKEFVVNESFARQLGFNNPQDAVGQFITSGQWDFLPEGEATPAGQRQAQIVGVVADFHLTPLYDQIRPMGISATTQAGRTMSVKLATTGKSIGDISRILADMENAWKEANPGERFEYAFYDDTIASFYKKEQKTAKIIIAVMAMAIFISCMGLFGLAMFTTKQRTKEIGIRKILGASMASILAILSGGFLKLVGIAVLIASPVAWYAMNRWLEGFAYHVPVHWWIFILAGILAVAIALITISLQTIKVARTNPVKAIKSE